MKAFVTGSTGLLGSNLTQLLLEQGFEVAVVSDATAAVMLPEGDGYLAALTNLRCMANALSTTEEAVGNIANG